MTRFNLSSFKLIPFKLAALILPLMLAGLIVSGCASQQQAQKDNEGVRSRARAHSDLGAAYYQQNKLEVALEEFTLAAQIDPTFGFAHNGLGLVYAALGQDDLASGNFKKAIALEPNNPESHNNYGNFLCARGHIDESIKEFLTAVKNPLYSTPATAYTNAGICAMRKKDNVNAEVYLAKALEIDPLSSVAAYQLASLQFKRNDARAAYSSLQNALIRQPSPDVLWLGIQITKALTLKADEERYSLELSQQYPNSEQAKRLKK